GLDGGWVGGNFLFLYLDTPHTAQAQNLVSQPTSFLTESSRPNVCGIFLYLAGLKNGEGLVRQHLDVFFKGRWEAPLLRIQGLRGGSVYRASAEFGFSAHVIPYRMFTPPCLWAFYTWLV
ncbi:hypothetical protein P0Y35_12405, partial [Kiritimatiellaeota bacterium B1221]|nr:hypothetical protein [Kiritimatiellaeota bacterium B1221]